MRVRAEQGGALGTKKRKDLFLTRAMVPVPLRTHAAPAGPGVPWGALEWPIQGAT